MTEPDAPDERRGAPADRAAADRAFAAALAGLSLVVWWPAFTLGAWGQLFFDQMLTVWVASTVAVVVVVVQRRLRLPVWHVVVLLVPSVWLGLAFLNTVTDVTLLTLLADLIGGVVGIVGLPFTLWTLLRVMWPDFFEQLRLRARVGVALVVAAVAVGSFLLGVYNDRFLTCADFEISGNSRPPGCVSAPTPAPTPSSTTGNP